MNKTLSDFPITRKWPAQHPDRLQLYSLPTPNGVKVSIALEETGLPYEPHLVSFERNDQTSAEFLSLNPNNKIPAIIDPDGPGGEPLPLFESGAILIYLADKTGRLMPREPTTSRTSIRLDAHPCGLCRKTETPHPLISGRTDRWREPATACSPRA